MARWCALACGLSIGLLLAASAAAQSLQSELWTVTERGPHHKVYERQEVIDLGNNRVHRIPHRYVELATGMHYWDEGRWKESREEFVILPDGFAVAGQGQHKVIISPVLNDSQGAVFLETPDGGVMRSTILGLSLRDRVTGESLLIGEIVETVGQQIAPNQILFEDCFDDVHADVRLTYELGGFHQDVILREKFSPVWLERNGFNSDTTRLEIWTEFMEAPAPKVAQRIVDRVDDPALRAMLAEPDVFEEELDFGVMKMHMGRAYARPAGGAQGDTALMPKRWFTIEGRTFLVESISLFELHSLLSALPQGESFDGRNNGEVRHAGLQPPSPRLARPGTNTILTASLSPAQERPGVVLDYQTINSSLTNFTFRADTTYYLTGPVDCYETTVIEGGAVLKYTNGTTVDLVVHGPLDCQTGPYRPAVLTAKDDNSIGETLSGSTGTPSGRYGGKGIDYQASGEDADLHDLRVRYKTTAVRLGQAGHHRLRNSQILDCNVGLALAAGDITNTVENVLFNWLSFNAWKFGASPRKVLASHVTFHHVHGLAPSTLDLSIANSLFVCVTNLSSASFTSVSNATNSSSSVFQTAGAGAHYLASGSTYRNAGTTNISSELRADFAKKTTHAPTVLSNALSGGTLLLTPHIQRDSDVPDLGYHYDPLDYITDVVTVSNTAVTVGAGTAIACYNDTGLWIADGSSITSAGTAQAPNWFTRYQSVQEQPLELGRYSPSQGFGVNSYHYGSNGPQGTFKFTHFSCPAGGGHHFYHTGAWSYDQLLIRDCELWNGQTTFAGAQSGGATSVDLKNNLFHRSWFSASGTYTNAHLSASHNLFYGLSWLGISEPTGGEWHAHNNVFDHCYILSFLGYGSLSNSHNAYINCNTNLLPADTNSIISTNEIAWQSGPLGDFYLPSGSALIDAGSTTADQAGLFHYTTTVNQVKEGTSPLDIGYHYVASGPDATDLIGYWPFEEGTGTAASDWSGYAHDGTLANGPAWTSGAIDAFGLDFDGVDDRVDVNGTTASYSFIQNSLFFTIGGWIKLEGDRSTRQAVVINSVSTVHKGFAFMWETYGASYGDHALRLVVFKGTAGTPVIDGHSDNNATISDDSWHHVAVVGDGSSITFYVDGEPKTTTYSTAFQSLSTGSSSYDLSFGSYAGTPALSLEGSLDEVRIYSRGLTSGDVASLYNNTFLPGDYDWDGVADYLEDINGNGGVDSGETDWEDASDLGLKVLITHPRGDSLLP